MVTWLGVLDGALVVALGVLAGQVIRLRERVARLEEHRPREM